jgi:hypothetical protein
MHPPHPDDDDIDYLLLLLPPSHLSKSNYTFPHLDGGDTLPSVDL